MRLALMTMICFCFCQKAFDEKNNKHLYSEMRKKPMEYRKVSDEETGVKWDIRKWLT